jgi:hypothetical protein
MAKPNPDRNITRANHFGSDGQPITGGYMVRFNRRGKSHQAYFSDSKHGSKKKALLAARQHRDEVEPKYRLITPLERAKLVTAANTSGTVGVRWTTRTIKKGKQTYTFSFATASWSIEGQRKSRAFSEQKYGKDKAWAMAVKARQAGLKAMSQALKAD